MWVVGAAVLAMSCGGDTQFLPSEGTDRDQTAPRGSAIADSLPPTASALPIDPAIVPAVAGEDGWNYHERAQGDLNGDGRTEVVVLTARVELVQGRPAWDDGQPWQVYVETEGGERTYLYAQRLQIGTLTLRVSQGSEGQGGTVLLLEHLPDQFTLYEATYGGPQEVSVAVEFQRSLDPRGETASPRFP